MNKRDIIPRVFCDMDGVVADFEKGVSQFSNINSEKLWMEIKKQLNFWEYLPKMKDADALWNIIEIYHPIMLSGVIQGEETATKNGKTEWMNNNFYFSDLHETPIQVIVTDSKKKSDFLYPGDILIDDKQENIDRWNEAGGIGILYTGDVQSIKNKLSEIYESPQIIRSEYQSIIDALRAKYPKNAFSGYQIPDKMRSYLKQEFGIQFSDETNNAYSFVCDHITRAMPAYDDLPEDAYPKIAVVGKIHDDAKGVQTLIASINNEIHRPDGRIYHITLALDNCENSIEQRGFRPKAYDSNTVIQDYIKEHDESALYNLSEPVLFFAPYQLFETEKQAKKEKAIKVETKTRSHHSFSDGKEGFCEINKTQKGVMTKYYYVEDGKNVIHNPDGPAIINIDINGKVFFSQNMINGKLIKPKSTSFEL